MLYGLTGIIKNVLIVWLLVLLLFFPEKFGAILSAISTGATAGMF